MDQYRAPRQYGSTNLPRATVAERNVVIDQMAQIPMRDPRWEEGGQGRLLHCPNSTILTVNGGHAQCYLPAVNFLVGDPRVVPWLVRNFLMDATINDINLAIRGAGLEFAPVAFDNDCIGLLRRKAGSLIIGGQVNGHMHWVGLNCFKGVMAMGNGTARFVGPGDLTSRDAADGFFLGAGLERICEVHALYVV
jgi:hypothetical protein